MLKRDLQVGLQGVQEYLEGTDPEIPDQVPAAGENRWGTALTGAVPHAITTASAL